MLDYSCETQMFGVPNQIFSMTTLYIKNMVCDRCKTAVRHALEQMGLHPEDVSLGEVTIQEDNLSSDVQSRMDDALLSLGFERIDDRKGRLIESIKAKVIQMIHHSEKLDRKITWSALLADEMHYEYNYLSNLFSGLEGITLEQYIIRQKIERVKEILLYDELNLSEIADSMGYSSVAHLSAQFKKITGLTPSNLKKSREINKRRKPLDQVS